MTRTETTKFLGKLLTDTRLGGAGSHWAREVNDFEKLGKNIGESVYLEPSGEISVTYGNDQIARLRNQ